MTEKEKKIRSPGRLPKVVIAAESVEPLETLTDRFQSRNPVLADRLLEKLSRARIVTNAKLPSQVVAIGRPVTYRDHATDTENTVTLVLPEDADVERGCISLMTPIAVALIGLAEGDSFEWQTRDGKTRRMEVLRVVHETTELEQSTR